MFIAAMNTYVNTPKSDNAKMNIKEASKYLGKCEKTIRRYINEGKLEAKKVPSKTGPFTWHINEESIKILKVGMELVSTGHAINRSSVNSFFLLPRKHDEVIETINLDKGYVQVETPISGFHYGIFQFPFGKDGSLPDEHYLVLEQIKSLNRTIYCESRINDKLDLLISWRCENNIEKWEANLIYVLSIHEILRYSTSKNSSPYAVLFLYLHSYYREMGKMLIDDMISLISQLSTPNEQKKINVSFMPCYMPDLDEIQTWLLKEIINKTKLQYSAADQLKDLKQEILIKLTKTFISMFKGGEITNKRHHLIPYLKRCVKTICIDILRDEQGRAKKRSKKPLLMTEDKLEAIQDFQLEQIKEVELLSDLKGIFSEEELNILHNLSNKDLANNMGISEEELNKKKDTIETKIKDYTKPL